jgi:hypothetical protein
MAAGDEINKIKKQLEDLKKSLDDTSSKNIDRIIKSFTDGKASLAEWNQQLDLFQTQADLVSDSLDYVSKSLSDSVNQLRRGDELLRKQVNSTRKLSSIADQLLAIRKGESTYDKKKIDRLKEETKLRLQILNSINQQNPSQALQEDIKAATELLDAFDSIDKTASNINKQLGILPQSAKGIDKAFSKLGLGNLGIADAIDETHRLGQEAARVGNKDFKAMSTFTGQLRSKLKESITLTNAIQLSFSLLVDALKSVDDGAGQLAKSMNMTYSEALGTQQELTAMAASSFDVALNTKNLSETLMFVGKQLGSNAKLNEADLKIYTKLREQAGFTNEELYGIQQLSLVNNKSLEKNTEEILGGAKAYASRNKLVVNEKDILREVSKASATIKLSLGGSAEAVAEAAVQAKQFGLNLEQADKIAQSLLQFESSIENELSAELLLGKDLNFEKARQLSLNNDIAGAAEEIAKQVGTSADFANMNAIQQEAIAKAAGLTKDELAQSLMDREALAKLSGVEGKTAQERFNNLVKEVGMEEAKKRLGEEGLANQFEQQSIQERFTQTVEKLKEIFVNVANALMPVFDVLGKIFDIVGPIVGLIGQMVGFVIDWGKYLLPVIGSLATIQFLFGGINKAGMLANVASKIGLITEGQKLALSKAATNEENVKNGLAAKNLILSKLSLAQMVGKSIAAKATAFYENSMIGSLAKQIVLGTKNLGIAIATAAAWAVANPVMALVGIGIAALTGAAIWAMTKGNDIMSPGGNGSGYGKRTLFGPEGAIQLNDKDTVIAGTNLFDKGDDVMSAPQGAISVSNSTAPRRESTVDPNVGMNARLDKLISVTERVNTISTLRVQ